MTKKRIIHLSNVENYYNDNINYIQIRLFEPSEPIETLTLTPKEAFDLSFKLKALALDMIEK